MERITLLFVVCTLAVSAEPASGGHAKLALHVLCVRPSESDRRVPS
jgi:hypothetical protein